MSESASLGESGVPNVEVDGYDPRVGHAKGARPTAVRLRASRRASAQEMLSGTARI